MRDNVVDPLDRYDTSLEVAEDLQDILIAHATGRQADNDIYIALRTSFMQQSEFKSLLPDFAIQCRSLDQFWHFIKRKFDNYADRREFIYGEFSRLLIHLESSSGMPADHTISATLKSFDEDGVHAVWDKALDRRTSDPEGAITAARTLLETVCKHILDSSGIPYDNKTIKMPQLYGLVAKELNISPSQHSEGVFKQILQGCSGIVNGLGTLRNRLGDSHGQGAKPVKPAPRHAELAVNLAGAMALFLISTWEEREKAGKS